MSLAVLSYRYITGTYQQLGTGTSTKEIVDRRARLSASNETLSTTFLYIRASFRPLVCLIWLSIDSDTRFLEFSTMSTTFERYRQFSTSIPGRPGLDNNYLEPNPKSVLYY